jgi:hypothetical protein
MDELKKYKLKDEVVSKNIIDLVYEVVVETKVCAQNQTKIETVTTLTNG